MKLKYTAQQAYDDTMKMMEAYAEGALLGGNPMQYIEKYAKEYHKFMLKNKIKPKIN